MLFMTLRDLAGLFIFGWLTGIATTVGFLFWLYRDGKDKR